MRKCEEINIRKIKVADFKQAKNSIKINKNVDRRTRQVH